MVEKFKNGNGVFVRFGRGTVRIKPGVTIDGVGVIGLATCEKTKIGEEPSSSEVSGPMSILRFTNEESIDVLIQKLEALKELMVERRESDPLPNGLRKDAIAFAQEVTGLDRPHRSQRPLVDAFEKCFEIMVEKGMVKEEFTNVERTEKTDV